MGTFGNVFWIDKFLTCPMTDKLSKGQFNKTFTSCDFVTYVDQGLSYL